MSDKDNYMNNIEDAAIHEINRAGERDDQRLLLSMREIEPEAFDVIMREAVKKKSWLSRHKYAVITIAALFIVIFMGGLFSTMTMMSPPSDNNNIDEILSMYTPVEPYRVSEFTRGDDLSADEQTYSDSISTIDNDRQLVSYLNSIIEQGDINPYYQDACWRLTLLYLKLHDIDSATTLLHKIIDEEQARSSDAALIIKRLNK